MEILLIIIAAAIIYIIYKYYRGKSWKLPSREFPAAYRIILTKKSAFYNSLNNDEKKRFEYKIAEFLLNCRITGISTEINDTDRLLVAASAIIPVFAFPDWKYVNLGEVLIYPNDFNGEFQSGTTDSRIMGMVGTGVMDGKMILSKSALHHGFNNERDKKNTAIHEFVHLIDKIDGKVDGVPAALLEKQYTIPWLDLIKTKMDDIENDDSDINPYAGTNSAEFFAVASEYFFERPKLMEKKHPQLYSMLLEVFNHDMKTRNLNIQKIKKIGRNDPCPCGSGKKFKKCCGAVHYKSGK